MKTEYSVEEVQEKSYSHKLKGNDRTASMLTAYAERIKMDERHIPIGWIFQHDETGRMTFCENDGVNNPENFAKNNPRYTLCGPAFSTTGALTQHPDAAAVDAFSAAMKDKLAEARAKGRGGWQDKADCPQQRLSDMLRAHVEKGDPRDVANFCMFLHQRGESILPGELVALGETR